MEYLNIANSWAMWLCAAPGVILVIIQAVLFAVKAYKSGLEIGMTKDQLMAAIRSSAVSSVGPSLAILSGLLALLGLAGGPMSWMRLSYIGNVVFETAAFSFGMGAAGATAETMTGQAFVTGLWVMVLGSIGWIIFSILFTDKMDKVQNKISGGNPKTLAVIGGGAMVGGMASMSAQHLIAFNINTIACAAGAAIMIVIYALNTKLKKGWLQEWSLTFALIGAVAVAMLFA